MSEESGTAVFSASSPFERRSKISYSREFLLSLAKADGTVKLPREVKLSSPCFLDDASGLLSPPFCVPANHLLHRNNEPYRPPCTYKAFPPSSSDGKDLLNSDTPGSAESTNQDKAKAEGERWRKVTVRLPKEEIWYSSKNTDSEEYSGTSLVSPATRHLNVSQRAGLIQPSNVPKATKGCCLQHHQMVNPPGTPLVMEPLQGSKPSNFFSQENCGNNQKNHGEVEYETLIQEMKLSNIPVCVHVSPPAIEICDLSESDTSTTSPVEGDKQSSSYSSSIDGRSNSSFELCLPDEESLICFDGPFLMSDVEKLTMVDDSMSSSAPSSPRDMIEKLVESLLNDESCPAPHLNDPIVHHGAGLEGYGYLPHAQHSYTEFCSNQLNLQRDEQTHGSFQKNSIYSAMLSSAASHSLPFSTACQPFALSHDELRRVHDQLKRADNRIDQSKLQQKINTGNVNSAPKVYHMLQ
ncbi:hypothetical protein AAHE18_19G282800 [Arachis hypogaea]|uniref:Uncharacterized protein n=1 Tax=Arachis hypogaea TaxID=3818 RepID=A0A6B9VEV2_ARAHY|nr:uncharacterized protein LOC112777211 isoform X2 [Arachis hypogaea]QHN80160.1 uncharacterized protein DS421_19g675960 [Arachis hypogaea]